MVYYNTKKVNYKKLNYILLLLPVCRYYRSKYASKIYIYNIVAVAHVFFFFHHGKQPIELDLLLCFCKMRRNSSVRITKLWVHFICRLISNS